MEGLLLAQELTRLGPLPQSHGNWRFPDADTFVLPVGDRNLWISSVPRAPKLQVREGRSQGGSRSSRFQQLLQARTAGDLLVVRQQRLDRVVRLEFGAGSGFVASPPAVLIVELAGRNSNLILTDASGRILGVQREITAEQNRHRQLLPGLQYRPPPEYDRPDPRTLGAEALAEQLSGRPLSDVRRLADGIGPQLTAALSSLSGLAPDQTVTASDLVRLRAALEQLLSDPQAAVEQSLGSGDLAEWRRSEERSRLISRIEPGLRRQVALLERRLADVERLSQAAARAGELRQQADLLLTWRPAAEPGSTVTVPDYSGGEVVIQLDPRLDAVQTAEAFYSRARRHEQRLETALKLAPGLEEQLRSARAAAEQLAGLSLPELRQLAAEAGSLTGQHRSQPGIRVQGPHGFEIVIGRNARDNDAVTFGVARSRDVWLHVQGYRGSHVIIRARNQDVPWETILFAAQLAAGHSQAADSDNVPVDYTLRKNVWRPRGAAAGAVHFTGQKTVWVTPLKDATRSSSGEL